MSLFKELLYSSLLRNRDRMPFRFHIKCIIFEINLRFIPWKRHGKESQNIIDPLTTQDEKITVILRIG